MCWHLVVVTVVTTLFQEMDTHCCRTHSCSIRTPLVARHGNDILVVTDLEKVLYDDAVDRADSHSQAGVSTSGNNRPFCFSGVQETSRDTRDYGGNIFIFCVVVSRSSLPSAYYLIMRSRYRYKLYPALDRLSLASMERTQSATKERLSASETIKT